MKPKWGATLLVLGAGVAAFAITTPYRYGTWLDPSATVVVAGLAVNYGTGLLSVLMHIAKVIFVAAIVPAWRRSAWAGAICAVVCVPLVVLSVWNVIALLALQRSDRTTEARTAIERVDRLRAELHAIGARLALVGWRPLPAVDGDIAAEQLHWLWDATSGCTKLAGGAQRQFCARFKRLEGARGVAVEAEHLRTREAELHRELAHQPVASENRQPDLVLLAAWLGVSLDTAENLRTLLWAAVVEIVEIAAFGFAGFFWSSRTERSAPIRAEHEPPPTTIDANGVRSPPPPRQAHEATERSQAKEKADRENRDRCAGQGSQPQAKRRAAPRDGDEERRAVDRFVATLRHGPGLRIAGRALRDAYERMREQHGWPKIPPNVFGQLVTRAVKAAGGDKVKASRQYYTGVALPPVVQRKCGSGSALH